MSDPIEARLGAIEAEGPCPHGECDKAWLVGLVRRYRGALEHVEAGVAGDTSCALCLGECSNEPADHWSDLIERALNEEVPSA